MMRTLGEGCPELLDASDELIADAVNYADPMVLRGILYQLTGDEDVRAIELKMVRSGAFEFAAPANEEDVRALREKAATFLREYRDAGAGAIGYGPEERLRSSMSLAVGDDVPEGDMELWSADLGLNPWARGLEWRRTPSPDRLRDFSVTVIGAGLGGLNAAVQLKRAGIPFRVVEKNSGVGGTWFENRYPGARVDTPSRSYTHIFGVEYPFPYAYSTWVENQAYFNWVADEFGVREHIDFDTEVRSLVWDESSSAWAITVNGPEGHRVLRSNAVITAVGFLNRPHIPEFEGLGDFGGESWHTARWPDGKDLSDKRVAVVGTGCTGYQMIPELARQVRHLTVFQRTPQYLIEVPGYNSPLAPQVGWLDRNLPLHPNFMRFRVAYRHASERDVAKYVNIDPDFDDPHAVSAGNKALREACLEIIRQKITDPELVAKMTPSHPPFSARPVVVDPDDCIVHAVQRENVSLVTEGISHINRTGIETQDGAQHDVDVIVFATGFRARDYLYPMTIEGRNGCTLEDLWAKDGPRAYVGCMMPGFPNLWSIYGPNTNGCLLTASFHELIALYAMQCMEHLVLEEKHSIDVKEDAYWSYNTILDERQANRVYTDPRTRSYYWSEHGRSITNCGFSAGEMWKFIRRPDLAAMEVR